MNRQEAFEIAIVDGINIYVREVLKARGCLNTDKIPDVASDDLLEQKYKIARELAGKWAKMELEQ